MIHKEIYNVKDFFYICREGIISKITVKLTKELCFIVNLERYSG